MAAWVKNYYAANVWYIFASVNLAFLTVAYHNYIHRRTNWRMYSFNLNMWSYRYFRVAHVISHHLYTNTLIDLQISTLEPVLCTTQERISLCTRDLDFNGNVLLSYCFFTELYKKKRDTRLGRTSVRSFAW